MLATVVRNEESHFEFLYDRSEIDFAPVLHKARAFTMDWPEGAVVVNEFNHERRTYRVQNGAPVVEPEPALQTALPIDPFEPVNRRTGTFRNVDSSILAFVLMSGAATLLVAIVAAVRRFRRGSHHTSS